MGRRSALGLVLVIGCLLAGASVSLAITGRFADVPASHPFATEIEGMAASCISAGYEDGTFRPGGPLTRQAEAAFLMRGLPRLASDYVEASSILDLGTSFTSASSAWQTLASVQVTIPDVEGCAQGLAIDGEVYATSMGFGLGQAPECSGPNDPQQQCWLELAAFDAGSGALLGRSSIEPFRQEAHPQSLTSAAVVGPGVHTIEMRARVVVPPEHIARGGYDLRNRYLRVQTVAVDGGVEPGS